MSRGRSFSTILEWFRSEGSIDEVRAVLPLCIEAAQKRTAQPAAAHVAPVKAVKQRSKGQRSEAAKRAWDTRRLNAGNSTAKSVEEGVTQ